MTTTRNTVRLLATTLALTAIAGLAIAQPPVRGQGLSQGQRQNQCNDECIGQGNGLLRGPAVTDTNVPGAQNSFAGRPMAGAADRPDDRPITMREFVRSVHRLDAPGIDPELRLNDGQLAVIEVMLREHRDASEAWRADHKDELRQLRPDKRAGDKPRGRRAASAPARGEQAPRPGRPMDRRLREGDQAQRLDGRAPRRDQGRTPMDENTKAQLKSLMSTRPSAEPQQAQIWDTLSPEQQAFVNSEIDRRRADALTNREMGRQRQQNTDADARGEFRKQRGGKQGRNKQGRGKQGIRQRPGLLEGETPDLFRLRMMQRIEQLPADRQEQALDRLNRALERMEQQQSNPNGI